MWSQGRLITAPVAVATWPDHRVAVETLVTSVVPCRGLLLCGSNRGTLKSTTFEPLCRWTPQILCARTLPPLRPPRVFSKLAATAHESYKLSVPSAPLGSCASSELALTSNHPLQLPNLRLPSNRSRTSYCVSSSWPARYRSVHALCSLV
jgi:hypothetical protein